MAIEFKLPEVSEGVASVDIAEVSVSPGDEISAGQVVMELETEKAVVELECPHAGTVSKVHVSAGDTVKIGGPLLTIEPANGATPKNDAKQTTPESKPAEAKAAEPKTQKAEAQKPAPASTTSAPTTTTAEAPKPAAAPATDAPPPPAGPATRRLARELGVDLHQVAGSGPGGRITQEDVQGYVRGRLAGGGGGGMTVEAPPLPDFSQFGPITRERLNKLARTSANNLSAAWRVIPHVTQHDLADITDVEAARRDFLQKAGKNGPKITMTAIAVKAAVTALKKYPQFNSSLDTTSDELVLKQYYHIGVAVDTEHGLVVPVIRDADQKSVLQIASELNDMAVRARERKLDMKEMQGGTFTITNLGGIGGTAFTPIVNYPEVAILGMSRSFEQLQLVDGVPQARLQLPLSLSYDHRVINGADAARFVRTLASFFADPFQLVINM
mgnify:FL=1